jgi:hypothetical protein
MDNLQIIYKCFGIDLVDYQSSLDFNATLLPLKLLCPRGLDLLFLSPVSIPYDEEEPSRVLLHRMEASHGCTTPQFAAARCSVFTFHFDFGGARHLMLQIF